MPSKTRIKTIAKAVVMGLKLAYGRKVARGKRETLYQLLDDMAVALTKEAIEEENVLCSEYCDVLGALADDIDMPLDPLEWREHKVFHQQ